MTGYLKIGIKKLRKYEKETSRDTCKTEEVLRVNYRKKCSRGKCTGKNGENDNSALFSFLHM